MATNSSPPAHYTREREARKSDRSTTRAPEICFVATSSPAWGQLGPQNNGKESHAKSTRSCRRRADVRPDRVVRRRREDRKTTRLVRLARELMGKNGEKKKKKMSVTSSSEGNPSRARSELERAKEKRVNRSGHYD